MSAQIIIIAAVDRNHAIGLHNQLLFYLPADLKRFKQLTTGHTIVMGRRTFESLPKGALPNRRNIVLTRQSGLTFPGAETFASLDEAMAHAADGERLYIIGGASVYKQAIASAHRLCLTEIQAAAPEADAYFPAVDSDMWQEVSREHHTADEKNCCDYDFVDYIRKDNAENT